MNKIENIIRFVISKIKRYGPLGVISYTLKKYSVEFLYNTGLCKYYVINNRGIKYRFAKTSVSKLMLTLPTIHDGDVSEMKSLSTTGSVIVDVGANIGTTSIPLSTHVGDTGKIISIEANPYTADVLRENVKLNKCENIQVLQLAIGQRSGVVSFSNMDHDDINKIESSKNENDTRGNKSILVPMMRLDDVLRDYASIDVIKIDVEGYEKYVLEGASETLKKTKALYIEYHEPNTMDFGYHREEIKVTLERAGFSCTLSDLSKHVIEVDNLIAVRR